MSVSVEYFVSQDDGEMLKEKNLLLARSRH